MTKTPPPIADVSEKPPSATDILRKILHELDTANDLNGSSSPTASFGDVIDRLDERAFGLMLLLLALPCCLPFIYLLPQLVALPMLALAGQLALGRHAPWLPETLKTRRFEINSFATVLTRAEKYLGFMEKIARPRLSFLTGRVGIRLVAVFLLVPTASILVPLPSTNTVPGIGVAVVALGMIERDGFLVLTGLVIGLVWVGLLGFFGQEAASLIKDWLAARL